MKVRNLDEIKTIIVGEKELLSNKYAVSKIGIFGSFSFGDFTKNSDIDILVDFKKSIGL
ncbi:MAG TPA: nucleotidyltransferase domain-containing protein, partial [Alphaproteobacteria bacterium]|nr:nucleotidyltransferase domain-containing protein [Alphaproteobacteria bacterium]